MNEAQMADLLGYRPEQRCRCETRFDQCVRRSTADDGYCDGCRDVRPNGGTRDHIIVLLEEDRLRRFAEVPDTQWSDAHYALVTADQMAMAERMTPPEWLKR